jgi:hypothetical protein
VPDPRFLQRAHAFASIASTSSSRTKRPIFW